MKIAVASSGLGHVSRGIETWALDTAVALNGRGVDVVLFKAEGGDLKPENDKREDRGNLQVSGFIPHPSSPRTVSLPCWRRTGRKTRTLAKALPSFLWRWGFKSTYGIEQFTFWRHLKKELVVGDFDILHVQDPMLAYWCNRARRKGQVQTKEILAHGTEESTAFLQQFEFVQHLAPWHLEQSGGVSTQSWSAIPNFVNVETFRPAAEDDERGAARRKFGIPEDAFVVGTVAAVKKDHKRIDYLVREFSSSLKAESGNVRTEGGELIGSPDVSGLRPHPSSFLLIAGSRQNDTDELVAMARNLAGDRIKILTDVPREDMPDLYRCMDMFVLTSLFEMMPIAVLEALASGLAIITNDHPVPRWMIGMDGGNKAGGKVINMGCVGELADCLAEVSCQWVAEHGAVARTRAQAVYATDVVIGEYMDYYEQVMTS